MKTRMAARYLNLEAKQMLSNIKLNLINDEVMDMAVDLHAQLSFLANKYEEESITDILPNIIDLLNKYDTCLKANQELVNDVKNLTKNLKCLEKQLKNEKEFRKKDLECSINNEDLMENEMSQLKMDIKKFKQINLDLEEKLRKRCNSTAHKGTQTVTEQKENKNYNSKLPIHNYCSPSNPICLFCTSTQEEIMVLQDRIGLLEEEKSKFQLLAKDMDRKLQEAYDKVAFSQENQRDLAKKLPTVSICTQNRFSTLLDLPEDMNSLRENKTVNKKLRRKNKSNARGCKLNKLTNRNPRWHRMSDTEIDLGFKAIKCVPENTLLLSPTVSHLLKKQDVDAFKETCTALHLTDYEFVVCTVNGRLDEAEEGGDHWSLLVSENRGKKKKFYHWDSAGGTNNSEAWHLATRLSDFLTDDGGGGDGGGGGGNGGGCGGGGCGGGLQLVNVKCRQQIGGVECGAYTVHNAEVLCSLLCNNIQFSNNSIFLQEFSIDDVYNRTSLSTPCQTNSKDNVENKTNDDPVVKQSSRRKVMVVGDSHARGMAVGLGHMMGEDCEVTASCYPGATMDYVLDRLEEMLQRRCVTAGDHVVLVGGTNDTSPAHYTRVLDRLPRIIASTQATIVLTELPYLLNIPQYQLNQISNCNKHLVSLSLRLNVPFIFFSHGLMGKKYFSKNGSHLSQYGKLFVCRKLSTWLKYLLDVNFISRTSTDKDSPRPFLDV